MYSVLRISGTHEDLLIGLSILQKEYDPNLKMNRQGKIILEFSKLKDWEDHLNELKGNLNRFLKVSGRDDYPNLDPLLDFSLDKPENDPDRKGGWHIKCYEFDLGLLKLMVENAIPMEGTIY